MRHLLWALMVAAVACKGGGEGSRKSGSDDKIAELTLPPAPSGPAHPLVAQSDAVLPLDRVPRPARVVWIGERGALEVATPPAQWDGKLPVKREARDSAEQILAELGPPPRSEEVIDFPIREPDHDLDRGDERTPATIATRRPGKRSMLVMPHSTAPAAGLVVVLAKLGGFVGVMHANDRLGALRLVFHPAQETQIDVEPSDTWVELHLGSKSIDIVAIPSNWVKTGVAANELATVVRRLGSELPKLDVLVSSGVPAQRLIDTLIALDSIGVTVVGLGASLGPAKDRIAALKQQRNARASFHTATAAIELHRIESQGDLEKSAIKEGALAKQSELTACYDKVLAKRPGLTGVVTSQFFIKPSGEVVSSSANGLDPEISICVAGVVKTIAYPKPKGGGGVQALLVFRFWPYEA